MLCGSKGMHRQGLATQKIVVYLFGEVRRGEHRCDSVLQAVRHIRHVICWIRPLPCVLTAEGFGCRWQVQGNFLTNLVKIKGVYRVSPHSILYLRLQSKTFQLLHLSLRSYWRNPTAQMSNWTALKLIHPITPTVFDAVWCARSREVACKAGTLLVFVNSWAESLKE